MQNSKNISGFNLEKSINDFLEKNVSGLVKQFTQNLKQRIETDPYTTLRTAAMIGYSLGGVRFTELRKSMEQVFAGLNLGGAEKRSDSDKSFRH